MAQSKHSSTRKSSSTTTKPTTAKAASSARKIPQPMIAPGYVASLPDGDPMLRKLAMIGEGLYLAHKGDEREAEERQRIAAEEEARRNTLRLTGKRLEQARHLVSDLAEAALAVDHLAGSIIEADDAIVASHIASALECTAKTAGLKADVLAKLIGGTLWGSFDHEFRALTEEEAAELEREEAEAGE